MIVSGCDRRAFRLCATLVMLLLVFDMDIEAQTIEDGTEVAPIYANEVDRILQVPEQQKALYSRMLDEQLLRTGTQISSLQFILLVDRNPNVQTLMLFWGSNADGFKFIGASPVSTGRRGYDHYFTPTGVFAHSLQNPDYRSEGTRNSKGIRGYGDAGMRVYDFGWQLAPKAWRSADLRLIRLQMHATDSDRLEPLLGMASSQGCIRIPHARRVS